MKTINISKVMFVQFRIDCEILSLLLLSSIFHLLRFFLSFYFSSGAINMRHDIREIVEDKTNTCATIEIE